MNKIRTSLGLDVKFECSEITVTISTVIQDIVQCKLILIELIFKSNGEFCRLIPCGMITGSTELPVIRFRYILPRLMVGIASAANFQLYILLQIYLRNIIRFLDLRHRLSL